MEWEAKLIELWKEMTFEQAEVIYMPVLVRALIPFCPRELGIEEAEDLIVPVVRRIFGRLAGMFRAFRHEVAFLDYMVELTIAEAQRADFYRCWADMLHYNVCVARFELILEELAHKIVMASPEDAPKLIEARQRVQELYEQWLLNNLPPRREEPPGSAPLGARPKPPVWPKAPGIARPAWEAEEPPRNP